MFDFDQLNNLYLSNKINEIFEFYDSFENVEELVNWMRKRPNGQRDIYLEEGSTDCVVVIPTIDHHKVVSTDGDEYVFRGMQTVFVESGESKYFNYARAVNFGILEALKFDPKWIIVSNDDIIGAEPITILLSELEKLDPHDVKTVFTSPPGKYHSVQHSICQRNKLYRRAYSKFSKRERSIDLLEDKFSIRWVHAPPKLPFRVIYRDFHQFILTVSFSIFSADYLSAIDGMLFDEIYINGVEDIDISYTLFKDAKSHKFISYKVEELVGTSLGNDQNRRVRDIANLAYMNQKIERGDLLL